MLESGFCLVNLASGTLANRRRDLKIETSKYTEYKKRHGKGSQIGSCPFLLLSGNSLHHVSKTWALLPEDERQREASAALVIPAFTAFPAFPATLADAPDV